MTKFHYVYDEREDDSVLDKLISLVQRRRIPLSLWKMLSKYKGPYNKRQFKIPVSVLKEWIEKTEYVEDGSVRLWLNIINRNVVSRIWIDKGLELSCKYDYALVFDKWEYLENSIEEWLAINDDWFDQTKRGRVFCDKGMYHFFSVSTNKWVAVRQFRTSGLYVKGIVRF